MAVSELFSGTAEDPYAHYRRLRAMAPVHWDPRLASWLLTDYLYNGTPVDVAGRTASRSPARAPVARRR